MSTHSGSSSRIVALTVRMDSSGNATSTPGFPLARGSAWAGGRDHTPSRVPQRWGATSCREAAPSYLRDHTPSRVPQRWGTPSFREAAPYLRDHTPSRVPQRWGTTSSREAAPLTYSPGVDHVSSLDGGRSVPRLVGGVLRSCCCPRQHLRMHLFAPGQDERRLPLHLEVGFQQGYF